MSSILLDPVQLSGRVVVEVEQSPANVFGLVDEGLVASLPSLYVHDGHSCVQGTEVLSTPSVTIFNFKKSVIKNFSEC